MVKHLPGVYFPCHHDRCGLIKTSTDEICPRREDAWGFIFIRRYAVKSQGKHGAFNEKIHHPRRMVNAASFPRNSAWLIHALQSNTAGWFSDQRWGHVRDNGRRPQNQSLLLPAFTMQYLNIPYASPLGF
jgi:hypothetical protein